MYMPHMPGGVTSSPQHQPQIYQQNLNHPAIPTMQVRNKHDRTHACSQQKNNVLQLFTMVVCLLFI